MERAYGFELMAEILVNNRINHKDLWTSTKLNEEKEKYADAWSAKRLETINLTAEQITEIFSKLNQDARDDWTAKYNDLVTMDKESVNVEKARQELKCQRNYDARNQRGDFLEIHEGGFWTVDRKGWGYPDFVLVVVPKVKEAEIKHMTHPVYDGEILKANHRCQIDLDSVVIDHGKIEVVSMEDLNITDKGASIGRTE